MQLNVCCGLSRVLRCLLGDLVGILLELWARNHSNWLFEVRIWFFKESYVSLIEYAPKSNITNSDEISHTIPNNILIAASSPSIPFLLLLIDYVNDFQWVSQHVFIGILVTLKPSRCINCIKSQKKLSTHLPNDNEIPTRSVVWWEFLYKYSFLSVWWAESDKFLCLCDVWSVFGDVWCLFVAT